MNIQRIITVMIMIRKIIVNIVLHPLFGGLGFNRPLPQGIKHGDYKSHVAEFQGGFIFFTDEKNFFLLEYPKEYAIIF